MPLAYDFHPEFGYVSPGPRVRRELRVAVVSILVGMVIGAAIVSVRAGRAVGTDGVSSNARLKPSSPDPLVLGIALFSSLRLLPGWLPKWATKLLGRNRNVCRPDESRH